MSDLTPDEQALSQALQPVKFLIADASTSRTSIRKFLSSLGIKSSNVEVAENLSDATDLMKKLSPSVVFADYTMDKAGGQALVDMQRANIPSNSIQAFFIITSKDSSSIGASAGEGAFDGVLIKPFTFDILKRTIVDALKRKVKPSPLEKAIDVTRALLEAEKWEEVLKTLAPFQASKDFSALGCALQAQALIKLKKEPDALKCLERGLKIEATHFRCMITLMDLHISQGQVAKAYDLGKQISAAHSVPLKRIPDFIKLSVKHGKFEDVVSFFEFADALAEVDASASLSLAAGLVVCGLYFFQKSEKENAIAALRKAEVASRGNQRILKRILVALTLEGQVAEVKTLMKRIPPEVQDSPEVKLAEIQIMDKENQASNVIQMGNQLLQQGIYDKPLFDSLIKRSIEAKRNPSAIKSLVEQAIEKYPADKAKFEEYLAKISG